MCVDSGATRATVLRPPSHRSPSATDDGGGIANPGCNGYIQHGSEPPRSKLGQTWFIDQEAHLLQSRVIVNSHSSKNRYPETIPAIITRDAVEILLCRNHDRYVAEQTSFRIHVQHVEQLYVEYQAQGVIHPIATKLILFPKYMKYHLLGYTY